MPESSLALQLSDLALEVGGYLGYSRTASAWSGWQASAPYVPANQDTQLGHVMACVQAGLREFYFPKQVDGGVVSHKWSFLVPEKTMALVANVGVYDLPDDFGGLEGEIFYDPSNNQPYVVIQRVGVGVLRGMLQQYPGLTSPPQKVAVYPKLTDGSTGQRWQLSLFPVPDQVYNLWLRYNVLPQALTSSNPYPYGGAAHGDTILESCLAIAESRFQDEPQGPHREAFMERLQASISVDVRDNKPEFLGKNLDRSDAQYGQSWMNGGMGDTRWFSGVLVNGVQF